MSRQVYEFEVDESFKGDLYAWKWGGWDHTSKWTSDIAILADDDDTLARPGLARAKNILLLAIPHQVVNSGLRKHVTYRTIRILTFSIGASGKKLLRKAVYSNVYADGSLFKGEKESKDPRVLRANYNEWNLTVKGGVDIIKPGPF